MAGMGRSAANHFLPEEKMPPVDEIDWDMWLGPTPWRPYNNAYLKRWHGEYDYHGDLTEWGSHTLDLCQMALNREHITPVRYKPIDDTTVHAWYADGIQVVMRQKGFRNSCAVRFEGDEGWVETDDSGDIQVSSPTLLDTRAIQSESWMRPVAHPAEFIACVRSRQTPTAPADALHIARRLPCRTIAYHLKRELTLIPPRLRLSTMPGQPPHPPFKPRPGPSNPARVTTPCPLLPSPPVFSHMRAARLSSCRPRALFAVRPLAADEAALPASLPRAPGRKDSARQTLWSAPQPPPSDAHRPLARPETFDSACLLLEALGLPEADAACAPRSPRWMVANRPV